jgi:hypothetical protein
MPVAELDGGLVFLVAVGYEDAILRSVPVE